MNKLLVSFRKDYEESIGGEFVYKLPHNYSISSLREDEEMADEFGISEMIKDEMLHSMTAGNSDEVLK